MTDPDILDVLRYVSMGRGYVDVEPYPDARARRALGRIYDEEVPDERDDGRDSQKVQPARGDRVPSPRDDAQAGS
jgi:hypothetical protein